MINKTIITGTAFTLLIIATTIVITMHFAYRNQQIPQQSYNLPTASEIFNLRSECAALGQKIMDNNVIGSALSQSQTTHYNPTTNRCFVELNIQPSIISDSNLDNFSDYLYDGQTKELLAYLTKKNGDETGTIYNGPENVFDNNPSHNEFEKTFSYIRGIMADDWKQ